MAMTIIGAVHGIGAQVRCETIQNVAARFFNYYGHTSATPLGRLHSVLVQLKDGSAVGNSK